MKNHVLRLIFLASIPLLSTNCGKKPGRPLFSDGSGPTQPGIGGDGPNDSVKFPPPDPKSSLVFELNDLNQDAVDYTFGSAKFVSKGLKSESIVSKRFLKVSNATSLTATQKDQLVGLCRDIGLSSSATEIEAAVGSGSSEKPIHLWWRSHYKSSLKSLMAELLTAGQKEILCVLKVEAEDNANIRPFYVAFDPLPTDAGNAKGSAQIPKAIDSGLMLPTRFYASEADEAKLIAVDAPAEILIAVEALNEDTIKATPEPDSSSCLLNPAKASALLNAKQALTSRVKFESSAEIAFGSIESKPIDGRFLKSCEAIKPAAVGKAVEAKLDCGIYQSVKNEGAEAGCQWDVELVNPKDRSNTIAIRMGLGKVAFKTFDIKKVDASLANLPQSPKNPVRAKAFDFVGFNKAQLKSMEQMFDLWLAVEPKSYDDDVDGYMRRISIDDCQDGVLGFAGLRSATFTICTLSRLAESDLKRADDPYRLIIQLITTAHEVRHAVKWEHDFENKSYQPCEGSAASAVTMHAIAAKCELDYCLVLKNMAIREFRAELQYSLNGDNRRFQGQCKAWTDDLGIKL